MYVGQRSCFDITACLAPGHNALQFLSRLDGKFHF